MKHIKRLLESDEKSKLRDIVDGIKAILIDFEDNNIISYTGNSTGNYDRYIDNLSIVLNNRKRLKEYHLTIECTIQIPILNEEGYMINKGFDIMEDILIATKRLEQLGYVVMINLNGNHHLYKPCVISIRIPVKLI